MIQKFHSMVKSGGRYTQAAWCAILALSVGVLPAFAVPPVIEDMGVDLVAWVPVVAAAIGLVILAALAVYFGMLVISVGLRWISSSLKRR